MLKDDGEYHHVNYFNSNTATGYCLENFPSKPKVHNYEKFKSCLRLKGAQENTECFFSMVQLAKPLRCRGTSVGEWLKDTKDDDFVPCRVRYGKWEIKRTRK